MRVVRWRKADTGVESFTITDTGVYFPVGKTDSSFKLKLKMAAGGQTAAVDTVRDATGTRTGYGAINVSGTTETKLGAVVSLATGIIVTAISGTLTPILDDEIAITTWPEWGIGRFPAEEDANAYVYGSNPPVGLTATIAGVPRVYLGANVRWVVQGAVAGAESFGMARFKAATKPRIFLFGDSNAVGQGTTNILNGFLPKLAELMGWRYGAFFGDNRISGFNPMLSKGSFASSDRNSPGALLGCAGASSSDLVFTPGVQMDSFDLWYPTHASGGTSVVVKVDDVIIDTFSQVGADSYRKRSYSIPLGLHTIAIQATGTGTHLVSGIETHDSTSVAPEAVNCAFSGGSMEEIINSSKPWSNLNAVGILNPDVVILHCTINELGSGVAEDVLKTRIDTFVNKLRTSGINAALTVSWAWSASTKSTDGTLDRISQYLKQSAASLGGAWADARFVVGASGAQTSSVGLTYDAYHLNSNGYAKYPPLFARMFL